MYSGYTYEQIINHLNANYRELLRYCDVLVDGKYEQSSRDLTVPRFIAIRVNRSNSSSVISWNIGNCFRNSIGFLHPSLCFFLSTIHELMQ
ncbi:4Fe-4S cluster-binding domain-containing protein [Halalkalibacterium halodurans]|uniref:4Fe-4S cluster-binding domain-containing protein n=1 Tax=Halalkalibacterium halodurans TaxID=86665 RepID=UPI00399CCE0F